MCSRAWRQVRRFVEFPDGRQISLPSVRRDLCAEEVSIVPPAIAAKRGRRSARVLEAV